MADSHRAEHGHSVASWTAVIVIMVAAVLIAIGVAWGIHALQIAGVVLVVVGGAAGVILTKAGFGTGPMAPPPAPQHLQPGVTHEDDEAPADSATDAPRHGVSEDDGPRSTPQTASN